MTFKYNFTENTKLLPLLDAYICVELAKKFSTALEVGVYRGGWLFTLKQNIPQMFLIGIDPYPKLTNIKKLFISERNQLGYKETMHLYSNFSKLLESEHQHLRYDVIHVDGEHSQLQVENDLNNCYELLNKKGILIIDDIFYHSYPGVTVAFFSFLKNTKMAPFLFTSKKVYCCNSEFYEHYYRKALNILKSLDIDFEVDNQLNKVSYSQSNSINGYSILVLPEHFPSHQQKMLLKNLSLKLPFRLEIKELLRILFPPILLAFVKLARQKYHNNK